MNLVFREVSGAHPRMKTSQYWLVFLCLATCETGLCGKFGDEVKPSSLHQMRRFDGCATEHSFAPKEL